MVAVGRSAGSHRSVPAWRLLLLCGALVLPGCAHSGGPTGQGTPPAPAEAPPQPPSPVPASPAPPPIPSASPLPSFDPAAAMEVVHHLSVDIGPREAASAAFGSAADFVAVRLAGLGYSVQRQKAPVPAGNSWGVPVHSGTTQNIIATPPGFDPHLAHRLIGAHLDTVPQAPGAEDNASGVGVLLELARMAAAHPTAVPVMFVAFGGEEPRGPGDALHHFGSRHLVGKMDAGQRSALVGMLSLDRVGVGAAHVPVCHGGLGSPSIVEELVAAADRTAVPVQRCENRTSDHWSFEKAGVAGGADGQHPVPGLPFRRRPAGRGRSGPARPGRPDRCGVDARSGVAGNVVIKAGAPAVQAGCAGRLALITMIPTHQPPHPASKGASLVARNGSSTTPAR